MLVLSNNKRLQTNLNIHITLEVCAIYDGALLFYRTHTSCRQRIDHELLYSLLLIAQSIQPPNFTKASTLRRGLRAGKEIFSPCLRVIRSGPVNVTDKRQIKKKNRLLTFAAPLRTE